MPCRVTLLRTVLTDLLTLAVLAFIGSRLVGAVRVALSPRGRERWLAVVRGLRPRHFLLALPVLVAVFAAVIVLVQLPLLSFGWWTALGGQGNPVVGSTSRTRGTPLQTLIPAVFLLFLIPTLPLFALREEEVFRAGSETRTTRQRLWWAVKFGLAHALVGIPIGAALGLSIGGIYFTWVYLRAWRTTGSRERAVLESARAHVAYNFIIAMLVVVLLATGAV
jgi:preprotein translocase subunit SecG